MAKATKKKGDAKSSGIDTNKVIAAISYLTIVGLILLLVEKKNKFIIFHAKQGAGLFAIEVILWILGFIPFVGLFLWIAGIAVLIAAIYGIVIALKGDETKIPVINEAGEYVAKLLKK